MLRNDNLDAGQGFQSSSHLRNSYFHVYDRPSGPEAATHHVSLSTLPWSLTSLFPRQAAPWTKRRVCLFTERTQRDHGFGSNAITTLVNQRRLATLDWDW
jgi:hypothetical protein